MDDAAIALIGIAAGVAVGLGILAAVNRRQQTSDPRFVSHNVVRDERGRIVNVESFRGMGGASREPAAAVGSGAPVATYE